MPEPLPHGDHLRSLDVAGLRREYLIHVPPGPEAPRPIVLLFHGTGGTARWIQEETRFGAFADRAGFLAVYPQGLPPDPDAPFKFVANPPAWNVGGPPRPGLTTYDDIGFLRALLDDLSAVASIDSSHVFATGFSSGASMTFRMAAEMSDRLAAIAPVAGYCRVERAGQPVPTLFLIGENDPMVPPLGGPVHTPWSGRVVQRPPIRASLDHWARLMGVEPESQVVSDADGIRIERYPGPIEFEVRTISGLGHHWPGGRGQLKRKLAGSPSDRLNANEVIWSFFDGKRR
jgi:polyhydroxybutyrate depolymerase